MSEGVHGKGILMVAGEPSGDRHGGDLARAIRHALPGVRLWGMGGEHMAQEGVSLTVNLAGVAVMGIMEVLGHLAAILRARRALLRGVDRDPPALAILIDFPDFNLRLARRLRRRGIRVLYYISPQVWAWRRGRLRLMARMLERVAVILPFEEALLWKAGIAARYVGHPLVEQVKTGESKEEARLALGLPPGASVLGLLPGSRPEEVESLLPLLLAGTQLVMEEIPEIHPVVALSPLASEERAHEIIRASGVAAQSVVRQAHRVIRASKVAVLASGTATLEAALLETPMVVVYRASWISYLVARLLVRVKHIALVNILAGEGIVPELIQRDLTPVAIRDRVLSLWRDESAQARMIEGLQRVGASLGHASASRNVAGMVVEMLAERVLSDTDTNSDH
jgi:lipid-A-disaccharide synthase